MCGIGSTGRIAIDIHNILEKKSQESYIAYGRDHLITCNTGIKIGKKIDNYIHFILTRVFDKQGLGSRKSTENFIEKVIEIDPDIIHLHNLHGYYLNYQVLFDYLKKTNKPVVWTLHDCWSFTGHCSHFDYIGCNKWKYGCNQCPQKNEYPKSIFFDNSQKNYVLKKSSFSGIKNLTIVTPSKWLEGIVKSSFLKQYPIKVIYNGIDLSIFKPTQGFVREQYNLTGKFIILGVANVWTEKKGFNFFLELSKMIKDDEVIMLVGLTEKQIEELPSNIIGIPKTKNVEQLAEFYSLSDVYINLTLEEVMGMTNVEALACGTPIITFDTGGSTECVDEATGFVIEKGNINQLVKAIQLLKKRGKKKYSESCIERAHLLYDKNKNFLEYITLYNKSINKL